MLGWPLECLIRKLTDPEAWNFINCKVHIHFANYQKILNTNAVSPEWRTSQPGGLKSHFLYSIQWQVYILLAVFKMHHILLTSFNQHRQQVKTKWPKNPLAVFHTTASAHPYRCLQNKLHFVSPEWIKTQTSDLKSRTSAGAYPFCCLRNTHLHNNPRHQVKEQINVEA
jgi:hypothetical protein